MFVEALNYNTTKRSVSGINTGYSFLNNLFSGGATKSGLPVNNNSALTLSAFYNGVTILANDIAKLPKSIYQKEGRNSRKATEHPAHYLMAKRPNQFMTSFMFHFALTLDAILKGNGLAEIQEDSYTGKPTAFQLIDQEDTPVTIKKYDNKLWYLFDGRTVPAENMLHIPGFSFNGITGIGVVKHAAATLGVALENQEFAQSYYANKGMGLGIVNSSKQLEPDAKTRIANAISIGLTEKARKRFGIAVLDETAAFQHIKITAQEALFLETNQMAIGEVARILNIPVYKLKDTQNQNNSNMEHQSIGHVSDSILPWKIKYEQEYDYKLFSTKEKQSGYFTKFNTAVLLLSDKKTQAEYYSTMVNIMALTPDEVRDLEDYNSIDGLNQPFVPVNTQTLEMLQLNTAIKKKELKASENE